MTYVIYSPDGSVLLDETSADREYRGQLGQSGDHIVEVYNTANGRQSFNVIFGANERVPLQTQLQSAGRSER